MPRAVEIKLTDAERAELQCWADLERPRRQLRNRALIVLEAAEGTSDSEIARRLELNRATAAKWRRRFVEQGIRGLKDKPRPGRPRTITDAQVREVIEKTLQPAQHHRRWSTRAIAAEVGLTQNAIFRIWRDTGVRPEPTYPP